MGTSDLEQFYYSGKIKIDDMPVDLKFVGEKIPDTQPDAVHSPTHYTSGGIECWDAMQAAFGIDAVMDFCKLNAFKYLWRADKKNGIEDIDKAIVYLRKYKAIAAEKEGDNEST